MLPHNCAWVCIWPCISLFVIRVALAWLACRLRRTRSHSQLNWSSCFAPLTLLNNILDVVLVPRSPGFTKLQCITHCTTAHASASLGCMTHIAVSDVDALFADCAATLGVSAEWANKSWVLKITTGMIPLIHAWNAGYAERAGAMPFMETWDFERLYSHIPLQDLKDSIMHVMTLIFQSDRRKNNPVLNDRDKKHGFWMPAGRAPA